MDKILKELDKEETVECLEQCKSTLKNIRETLLLARFPLLDERISVTQMTCTVKRNWSKRRMLETLMTAFLAISKLYIALEKTMSEGSSPDDAIHELRGLSNEDEADEIYGILLEDVLEVGDRMADRMGICGAYGNMCITMDELLETLETIE